MPIAPDDSTHPFYAFGRGKHEMSEQGEREQLEVQDRLDAIARVEKRGLKIMATYVHPPIPVRDYDWSAHIDGQEEKASWYGWGRTQQEAIDDLLDNLDW